MCEKNRGIFNDGGLLQIYNWVLQFVENWPTFGKVAEYSKIFLTYGNHMT